jgi:hypothetical protein
MCSYECVEQRFSFTTSSGISNNPTCQKEKLDHTTHTHTILSETSIARPLLFKSWQRISHLGIRINALRAVSNLRVPEFDTSICGSTTRSQEVVLKRRPRESFDSCLVTF